MSMIDLYVLAGSAAVIAVMVGVAYLLGFRGDARITEAELALLVAQHEPGGRIDAALIAADGRAALARLTDGRIAIARAMGDGLTLRTLPARAVALHVRGDEVIATFADLGFPPLKLRMNGTPPAWIAEMARGAGS